MTNIDPTTTELQIPLPENAGSPTPEFLPPQEIKEVYQGLEKLFAMSGITGNSSDRLKELGKNDPKGWRRIGVNSHQNLDMQTVEFLKKSGRKYDKVLLERWGRTVSSGPEILVSISHQVGIKGGRIQVRGEENLSYLLTPKTVTQPTFTDISGNRIESVTTEDSSKYSSDIEELQITVREHMSHRLGNLAFS